MKIKFSHFQVDSSHLWPARAHRFPACQTCSLTSATQLCPSHSQQGLSILSVCACVPVWTCTCASVWEPLSTRSRLYIPLCQTMHCIRAVPRPPLFRSRRGICQAQHTACHTVFVQQWWVEWENGWKFFPTSEFCLHIQSTGTATLQVLLKQA